MSYMKGVRAGSEGNKSLLHQYTGGNSGGARNTSTKCYATGGSVKGGNPSLSEGLSAAGTPAKPSLARPGRKMAGKGKGKDKDKGKTNINVIVMGSPSKPDAAPPGPPMPPLGAGPPPGAMPPPDMPMRAHGGRVKRADGGPTPGEQMKEARKRRDDAAADRSRDAVQAFGNAGALAALSGVPGRFGKILKGANAVLTGTGTLGAAAAHGRKTAADAEMKRLGEGRAKEGEEDRKSGGRVNSDKSEDKPLIKSMVHKHEQNMHKGQKLTKLREGGPAMGLKNKDGGAGGAAGRLAKIRMYGK